MQVPNFYRLPMLALTMSLSLPAFAQLTAAEKTNAVQTIAKHIASNYIYPEKGGQIASHIQLANHKGEFKKAANWNEFNSMVTLSLQKFSNDGHLYVKNDPQVVKELRSSPASRNDRAQVKDNEQETHDSDYGFKEASVLEANVGYLKITEINISKKSLPVLYEAMRKVENTRALIIDLRDNGGGGSEAGPVIESYFLPDGQPLLEFTSRKGVVNTDSTVTWLKEKIRQTGIYYSEQEHSFRCRSICVCDAAE